MEDRNDMSDEIKVDEELAPKVIDTDEGGEDAFSPTRFFLKLALVVLLAVLAGFVIYHIEVSKITESHIRGKIEDGAQCTNFAVAYYDKTLVGTCEDGIYMIAVNDRDVTFSRTLDEESYNKYATYVSNYVNENILPKLNTECSLHNSKRDLVWSVTLYYGDANITCNSNCVGGRDVGDMANFVTNLINNEEMYNSLEKSRGSDVESNEDTMAVSDNSVDQ